MLKLNMVYLSKQIKKTSNFALMKNSKICPLLIQRMDYFLNFMVYCIAIIWNRKSILEKTILQNARKQSMSLCKMKYTRTRRLQRGKRST